MNDKSSLEKIGSSLKKIAEEGLEDSRHYRVTYDMGEHPEHGKIEYDDYLSVPEKDKLGDDAPSQEKLHQDIQSIHEKHDKVKNVEKVHPREATAIGAMGQ